MTRSDCLAPIVFAVFTCSCNSLGDSLRSSQNDVLSTLSPGGVYVFELAPDGVAMSNGSIQFGDQLVGVCGSKDKKVVFGKDFEEAIGAIKDR